MERVERQEMQIGVRDDGDMWCSDFANQWRHQAAIELG